jgi:hypothetical protein
VERNNKSESAVMMKEEVEFKDSKIVANKENSID